MKQWDDIIKDRLDGYESPLPEGALDRFHARQVQKKGSKKGLRIALAATLAAAAAAAAVFIIPRHSDSTIEPTEAVGVVEHMVSSTEIAPQTSVVEATQPALQQQLAVHTPARKQHNKIIQEISETSTQGSNNTDEPVLSDKEGSTTESSEPAEMLTPPIAISDINPISPAKSIINPKIERAVFAGTGTALLAGLASGFLLGGGGGAVYYAWPLYVEDPVHFMPVRIGATVSLPVTKRVHFISGLEYLNYSSVFNYTASGQKRQVVQYLGVPMRIDWTFASAKRLDFYLGGGVEALFCLAASQPGKRMNKDYPHLSLVGAAGVQYHINNTLGIYLEPVASWTRYTIEQEIKTYDTSHPVAVSVSTGIRININNR